MTERKTTKRLIMETLAASDSKLTSAELGTRIDRSLSSVRLECHRAWRRGDLDRTAVYDGTHGTTEFQYQLKVGERRTPDPRDPSRPWQQRCPEGHANVRMYTRYDPDVEGKRHAEKQWFCRSCAEEYQTHELTRYGQSEGNVSMGQIWTPDGFRDAETEVEASD